MNEAVTRNPHTLEAFTLPFPNAPDRGLSHDAFRPRPREVTAEGAGAGGRRWLSGSPLDLRFTRALCAPSSSTEGGHGDDPASAFGFAVANRGDGYPDYARFCADLRQQEKGRRDRALAGRHEAIPGADALSHCRRRGGAAALAAALAVVVGRCSGVGLSSGDRRATDGQLEPAYARFKGWAYVGQACRQLPLAEASQQERCRQLQAGAKRLESRGPVPEVVQTVLRATTKPGQPREPRVALLDIADRPAASAKTAGPPPLSALLSRPTDQLPPLRLQGSHLTKGPQGALWGSCPKVPADLEANGGDHLATKAPPTTERVFGYRQQKTTQIDLELG